MPKPIDPEQILRDQAAVDYCKRLAQIIRYRYETLEGDEKAAFNAVWKRAFHFPVDGLESKDLANVTELLFSQPRAQARLATICDYPPGKWLLEQELTAKGQWPPEAPDGVDPRSIDVYDYAKSLRLTGICFSGGGIRSATFNLGVLQGLAAADRLNSFDYLSSVSGGGYIHQFLASWISCETIEEVRQQLQPLPGPPSQRAFWPEPLRWLRRYSNYLTPQVGLFTADTWVAFAIWARNTFLNQIVLIAAMLVVLLLPHFYLSSKGRIAHFLLAHGEVTAAIILLGFGFASCVIGGKQIKRPPADHCNIAEETGWGQAGILLSVFLPVLIAVLAFCPYLYRSSFWAGNLLPHARHIVRYGPESDRDRAILRVVDTVGWENHGSIVPAATRAHISRLHRLAAPSKPKQQMTASCIDNGSTSSMACTALFSDGVSQGQAPSAAGKADFTDAAGDVREKLAAGPERKPKLPPVGEPSAIDNIRAWQTAYSFRWWKPIGIQTLRTIPLPAEEEDAFHLYWPVSRFGDDRSTSWVFTAMLLGISMLVLSASRAIPRGWGRLILILAVIGAIGTGYVLINLSRLVVFMASFFLPLEHVTRSAIPLLPWLGVTIVFVSIEIAGGFVGNLVDESVREWFARLRAWSFLFGIVWFALTACSLIGPGIVSWLFHAQFGAPVWLAWLVTTLASVLVGKNSSTSGTAADQRSKATLALDAVALLGPPVFITGLLLTLSWVVEKALHSIESQVGKAVIPHSDFLLLLGLLVLTLLLFGWRIDVNEFSLHSFYRDRIARCYGGASDPDRVPNRFTGFAARDKRLRLIDLLPKRFSDHRMRELWANACGPDLCTDVPRPPTYEGPFPIFNTTLNLSFGQDLAYQERKGASFIFTPLYCGYDVGWTETDTRRIQFNGYTPTRSFAYKDGGPRIATAVATSGAAMSPNWGFHSSPTMAFLLTIFNVRLGLWIRNPRHKRFRLSLLRGRNSNPSSPWFGLFYLLAELFGMVNDTAAFVYLTDGGHFENMGLYELVRRHCSTIVICDSEQDNELTFQGIGMAIRKCRIDHGAELDLDLNRLTPRSNESASPCCCVEGVVRYSNGTSGKVLYLKSVYTAGLPADLVNYRKENPSFPNTSTADQWFSESQFESYRRLGQAHAQSVQFTAWMAQNLPVRPSQPPASPPSSGEDGQSDPGAPPEGAVPAPTAQGESDS